MVIEVIYRDSSNINNNCNSRTAQLFSEKAEECGYAAIEHRLSGCKSLNRHQLEL